MFYVLFLVADTMQEWYESRVIQHNAKQGDPYADSGFDLASPINLSVEEGTLLFMDFKIKAAMYKSETPIDLNNIQLEKYTPSGYYLYPRSSISKSAFRLANSAGIIDRGYRGNIGAYFDCKEGQVETGQRLVQLCSPTLDPFHIVLTDSLSFTERGANGFGSTGKI